MKKLSIFITLALFLGFASSAGAWCGDHHKQITSEALAYMGSSYATAEQKRAYNLYVRAAGGLSRAQNLLGQAAKDVDYFMDTRMGGWWCGYHYTAGDLSVGLIGNNYTSLWHFITMTRGKDAHGNDRGGYDVRYRTDDPSFIDNDAITKYWLYNQELKKADYKSTEAHYRQGSYSSRSQYKDYQKTPWQPVDNLGLYWFKQFAKYPSFQTLGHATHAATDSCVAQHTWNTLGNRHSDYEEWVEDHHDSENLGDFGAAYNALKNFDAKDDYRSLLTQCARDAYINSEPLFEGSHATQLNAASIMVPQSIAVVVTVLTKAINILYGEDSI
jgi:hypothetical protein